MNSQANASLPVIAVAMGDPSGISPELTARILAESDLRAAARYVVFGDLRLFQLGCDDSGLTPDLHVIGEGDAIPADAGKPVFIDLKNHDPADLERGKATLAGGKAATDNFRRALELGGAGKADAVFFTPFNKAAMRFAYPGYDDEIRFVRDVLKFEGGASEFNILDKLWNCRVTSHIPLSEVARNITQERILRSLDLSDKVLREAGFNPPRIAVAAINPHAGDGGNFGRDEIETIEPAVQTAKAKGYTVEGPFPSDTVFVRARNGDFDAVLTMFHDQGQIAMKLMGFDRGVTLIGGFPFPICSAAHGTAYDIAGKGIANLGACRAALSLAIKMANESRAAGKAAA
jgi:4-hydroxythreonine-4-phosphate dehydrogenase